MLKYLYYKNQELNIFSIVERQAIKENYSTKYYFRNNIKNYSDLFLVDNGFKFFVINKKNIEKNFSLIKDKNLFGKSLILNTFLYSGKKKFNFFYFSNFSKKNYKQYLKLFFLYQRTFSNNNINPLIFLNKGTFNYIYNGLHSLLPKKNYLKFKKKLKLLNLVLNNKDEFKIKTFLNKEIINKFLFINAFKTTKLFITKNTFKNQLKLKFNSIKRKHSNLKFKKRYSSVKEIAYENNQKTTKKSIK